ncbi:unnamed protein product [Nippostrongylus brasiliensis]|uniref:Coiled-coil domain-containing protein 176 n=1 Tax=Nippostrongylus brasiliensis TaxID=27835 RepID=A0A0N4XQV0_NIPBR|nr:unnamed protein product [Nippostrongylus brasiliensis]
MCSIIYLIQYLEREKRRLEEQYAEKDRTLRDRMQMQLSEKESVLEIARKSLETRMAEIVANKEHLDRAKADFHAKFAADVDSLNQEWAKICAKKEELKSVFRLEFEAEQRDLKEKSAALEKENALLKKKLKDCTMGLDEMQSKLTKMANLEVGTNTPYDILVAAFIAFILHILVGLTASFAFRSTWRLQLKEGDEKWRRGIA